MNEYASLNGNKAMVDVQQFEGIERMEERRANVIQENAAIHTATVKEWDTLYEAICKLAARYESSEAFQQSQIARQWFAPVQDQVVKAFSR